MSEEEKENKKSPSESFAEMVRGFGNAMAEIFNDPKLKQKAKEFGDSLTASAKAFADRFKDEEVKRKFKDLGKAAKDFGESIGEYFKDNVKKNEEKESHKESSTQDFKKKPENAVISDVSDQDHKKTVSKKVEHEGKDRNVRITGYAFTIAWSIVLIIFFNFFNRYIAYYEYNSIANTWNIYSFLTERFDLWLPLLNTSLIVNIIGNIILIFNDGFYFNNITNIVMHLFSIVASATLLSIFPFDFSVVPGANLNAILYPVIKILLIVIIVGLSISILVRFIKILVKTIGGMNLL